MKIHFPIVVAGGRWLALLLPLLTVVAAATPTQAQERRARFDPASFLQRLDRNANGVLEQDEMVGRSKGFIENLGIDASGPVPIDNVLKVIDQQRQEADQKKAKTEATKSDSAEWSSPRLVPGFGEETAATAVPPGFDLPGSEASAAAAKAAAEVSESVISQVDRVLGQYDQNKDGVLDSNEIQNTPWGEPSPQASDTNGDGRLTRDELIERYRKREADSARFNGDNNRGPGNDNNDRGPRRSDNESSRRSERSAPSNSGSVAPASSSEKPTSTRSSSPENRIADYVQNLLKQYDSNNDGSISAEEQGQMKSPPKKEADADSNGQLSRDELTTYYGGGYRQSSSAAAEPSKPADSPSNSDESSSRDERRRESRRERESSRSTAELVGQKPVKMSEFTDEWTEEKLAEFRELDANHDGVISVEEYRRRK